MNDHFDEEQERWLAADPGDRSVEDFERKVLSDPERSAAAYAALELEEALRETAASPRRITNVQRWSFAGGLMAAVLAFVLLMPQSREPGGDLPLRLRGSGDAGAAVGLEPDGEFDSFPMRFVWHSASADTNSRYRWELYDAQARRRGVAVVTDTVLVRAVAETPVDSLG